MQGTQLTKTIKCVVVGDDDVGKSSLIALLTGQETPPQRYSDSWGGYCSLIEPTTLRELIKLKRHFYSLSLWDTASDEGCDRLRPLAYPQTDVFLICFSVDSPASFSNVRDKWLPEIQHFAQGIPIIFVGLQTDLRDKSLLLEKHAHPGTEMVTKHEGEQMARKYSSKYLEGTVFHRSDLDSLALEAILAVVNQPKSTRRKRCTKPGCTIL